MQFSDYVLPGHIYCKSYISKLIAGHSRIFVFSSYDVKPRFLAVVIAPVNNSGNTNKIDHLNKSKETVPMYRATFIHLQLSRCLPC